MFGKSVRRIGDQRKNRDPPNYGIVKISQETEKIHGEPRSFAVSHSREQPPANAGGKNSQIIIITTTTIIIIIIDKT